MRPGITGLSQVNVRNSVGWNERIKIDLEYIDGFTLFLDIKILLYTIREVLEPERLYLDS